MNKPKRMKNKKQYNILKIIFIILVVIFTILFGIASAGYMYVNKKLSKIETEKIDLTDIGLNDNTKESLKQYRNIALLGIDSRADDYGLGNRSDCIIIASLNQKTNEIKLISVYRDTYVYVTENKTKKLDKITHAYSYGGAQNTIKSLNEALDLNITEYVTVNFDAVIDAVDALEGVSITVDSSEVQYINKYIDELIRVSGKKAEHITKPGTYTMNGVQAVAFSRIRYTAGGDYKRTERMRTVVEAMLNKVKTLNMSKLNNVADTVLPRISTNISKTDIWGFVPNLTSYKVTDNLGWPYETKGDTINGVWYGVPINLRANVEKLHQEALGQNEYEASETVKEMSEAIIKKTGYK